eukprot:TRINITY_DN104663_c0_g1_i1.p4 TRINITY_DN104663_c0_g1~~TRINITY_DN104663_c0_g1_i1.p4  ORF type:complete len:166 (-),score=44.93 TRINITY_DN104663_c0_g1_i1:510-1007(-)
MAADASSTMEEEAQWYSNMQDGVAEEDDDSFFRDEEAEEEDQEAEEEQDVPPRGDSRADTNRTSRKTTTAALPRPATQAPPSFIATKREAGSAEAGTDAPWKKSRRRATNSILQCERGTGGAVPGTCKGGFRFGFWRDDAPGDSRATRKVYCGSCWQEFEASVSG